MESQCVSPQTSVAVGTVLIGQRHLLYVFFFYLIGIICRKLQLNSCFCDEKDLPLLLEMECSLSDNRLSCLKPYFIYSQGHNCFW